MCNAKLPLVAALLMAAGVAFITLVVLAVLFFLKTSGFLWAIKRDVIHRIGLRPRSRL